MWKTGSHFIIMHIVTHVLQKGFPANGDCAEKPSHMLGWCTLGKYNISFSSVSIKISNYSGGVKDTIIITKEYNNKKLYSI